MKPAGIKVAAETEEIGFRRFIWGTSDTNFIDIISRNSLTNFAPDRAGQRPRLRLGYGISIVSICQPITDVFSVDSRPS